MPTFVRVYYYSTHYSTGKREYRDKSNDPKFVFFLDAYYGPAVDIDLADNQVYEPTEAEWSTSKTHTPQSFKILKPSHFINLFPSRYWSQSSHATTSSSLIKPPTVTGETHPPSSMSFSSHVKPFISIIRVMSSQQLVTKSENVTKVIITTVIKRNGFC